MSLQCTITSNEGKKVEKRADVVGTGKSYLANLSEKLSVMRDEINSVLTDMVEAEREGGGKATGNGAGRKEDSKSEGTSPVFVSMQQGSSLVRLLRR